MPTRSTAQFSVPRGWIIFGLAAAAWAVPIAAIATIGSVLAQASA